MVLGSNWNPNLDAQSRKLQQLYTIPDTTSLPLKIGILKRKGLSSSYPYFLGAKLLLVSGSRVSVFVNQDTIEPRTKTLLLSIILVG